MTITCVAARDSAIVAATNSVKKKGDNVNQTLHDRHDFLGLLLYRAATSDTVLSGVFNYHADIVARDSAVVVMNNIKIERN